MKLSKEALKTIIKEELEAALEEGDAPFRKGYRSDPSKRPVNTGTGGPNPDYPPKEISQDEKLQSILSMIRSEYPNKDVRITLDGVDIEDEAGTK
jgi:hypothetical protein